MAGCRTRLDRGTEIPKNASSSRGRKSRQAGSDGSKDIYREMLDEVGTSSSQADLEARPLKRRKVARSVRTESPPALPEVEPPSDETAQNSQFPEPEQKQEQTIYEDSAGTSDESDVDFEDVDLVKDEVFPDTAVSADVKQDLSITLEPQKQTPSKTRAQNRLPSSRVEKQKRINVHKVHLQCLLAHVYIRNTWCNDSAIQKSLKPLLNKRIVAQLKKPASAAQSERSRAFTDGLKQAGDAFRPAFKINTRGMSRSDWSNAYQTPEKKKRLDDLERPIWKSDFVCAAQTREGSRDIGAQLFCALLRSVGVDARLVCSLQPMPFNSAPPAPSQPADTFKCTITQHDLPSVRNPRSPSYSPSRRSTTPPSTTSAPTRIKRFGGRTHTAHTPPRDLGLAPPTPKKHKPLHESPYPIYWTEAFSPSIQKWIPIDPLVTLTTAKPRSLEPPASDTSNTLTYAIAFESDGTARDVTRRYAKAFNAKTRRARIETTPSGKAYWARCLAFYHGDLTSDRDVIEDAELAELEAKEAMPRAIADFNDHPVYALERHLRRHDVLWPRKRVGTVSAGRGGLEDVFRRADVQSCKSGVKWYREGREVKEGEQPLKVVVPMRSGRRRGRDVVVDGEGHAEMDDGAEEAGTNLYALHQTSLYHPPPAMYGRVPRNTFGNLDVYVSSMIPSGSVHVHAVEGAKAAKLLGIDYVDAVTGFTFKSGGKGMGRRGKAVTNGVIVAREFAEAMRVTVECLRWAVLKEEEEERVRRVLGLWKKFLVGLRVLERLKVYDGSDEEEGAHKNGSDGEMDVREEIEAAEKRERVKEMQGGFMPDIDADGNSGMAYAGVDDSARNEDMAAAVNDIDGWNMQQNGLSRRSLDIAGLQIIVPSPWDRVEPARYAKDNSTSMAKDPPAVQDHTDDLFGEEEGGGGFLPEKDHLEKDGGFVSEDNEYGGGYFLLDGDDGGGGGFMPEDANEGGLAPIQPESDFQRHGRLFNATEHRMGSTTASAAIAWSAETRMTVSETPDDEDALMSGALQGSEADITMQSQPQSPVRTNEHSTASPHRESEAQRQTPQETSKEKQTHDPPTMQPNNKSSDNSHKGSAEEDDQRSQTSMLSHDPDDSDAEPEWL